MSDKNQALTDQQLLDMFYYMLLARRSDERMWLLNRSGKIPFVVSCQGQEAMQVASSFALEKGTDYTAPYYRDVGVVLTMGMTVKELFLQAFAKAEDPNSGGRQMPGHFGHRKLNMLSGSSPVTTQVPHAVGMALALKMKQQSAISFVTLGEGSSNQGDFHEGLNFASVHDLPVIVMVENNQYAISCGIDQQVNCAKISDRAIGYGIHGETVDGNDPVAVYTAVKQARERALNGEGPSLIEAVGYRLTPHSSDDNDLTYRTKEEVDQAKEKDGLIIFRQQLKKQAILTDELESNYEAKIKSLIDEATTYADEAPYADEATLFDGVYHQ